MLRDASPVPRPTTNPNSPMSCSPTSWPGGCRPHRCPIKQSSPRTGAPRDGEHIVWSRRSRHRPATAHPNAATFHENPDPGRRHLHPRGLRSSSRAGDGPVLHQQQPKKSSPRSYDQAVAARLWQKVMITMLATVLACSPSTLQPSPTPSRPPIDYAALEAAIEKAITSRPATLDNVRAVLINVDDKTKIAHYRHGFTGDHHEHVWSVTKSVLSTLIGIAIADGLIADLDQPLSALLPEHQRP